MLLRIFCLIFLLILLYFLNTLLLVLVVLMKYSITHVSGNNLLIISQPGDEITLFMPLLTTTENIYILVMSDLYANSSSLGTRFHYLCNHMKNVKKCYFAPLKSINIKQMENKIRNLCKKLHIMHIFTYRKNKYDLLKYAISQASYEAVVNYNKGDEIKQLSGKYIKTEELKNYLISTNTSHEWPYPSRPVLYKLFDQPYTQFMISLLTESTPNIICTLSPFIDIDKKLTKGLTSMKIFNAFRNDLSHHPPSLF